MTERVPATLVPQWKIDTAAIPRKMRLAHFVAPLSYRGRAGLRLRIALDVHRRPWYLWKHNGETVAASCDFETSLSQSGRWANGFHAGAAAGAAEALEKNLKKVAEKP